MKRLIILLLIVVVHSLFEVNDNPQTSAQQNSAQTIETGKFRIYETKQLRGEESYELNRSSDESLVVQVKTEPPFMGEEKKPSLTTTLQTKPDLTPKSFETKGIRPLEVEINTSIRVQGKTAAVHYGNNASKLGGPNASTTQMPLPENFFTLAGYLPITIEMMLVRYWIEHGRKNSIALLPAGEAFIEFRGRDTVTLSGKRTILDRYHLSGNNWPGGWGRQTLWFDSANHLVAAVNLGSEVETNLYAIRDGYDSAISFFLKRTVEDGIDRLTRLADQLSPKNKRLLVLLGGTVIDVIGKPPITNSAVVIQGDRIIVAGTEVGVPGHTLHRELELYVKAGLTPLEAIQAATITPARVMKLENEVGTIGPGKRATS